MRVDIINAIELSDTDTYKTPENMLATKDSYLYSDAGPTQLLLYTYVHCERTRELVLVFIAQQYCRGLGGTPVCAR